ncbi:MAG: hypothetical protein ACLFPX_04540 [Candidatus Omnitrophota bacterium]
MDLPSSDILLAGLLPLETLLIIALIAICRKQRKRVYKLKDQLRTEREKRMTPLLGISIQKDAFGLTLINEGNCLAKNIRLAEVRTAVGVGFEKHITLRFTPVDMLKPGKSQNLKFEVLDKDQPLPPSVQNNIGSVLLGASFPMTLACENQHGIGFILSFEKTAGDCRLTQISFQHALDENTDL